MFSKHVQLLPETETKTIINFICPSKGCRKNIHAKKDMGNFIFACAQNFINVFLIPQTRTT